METVSLVQAIVDILNSPGGVVAVGIFLAFGLWKRKIVLGWLYDECCRDRDKCRQDLADRVAKSEAKLEKLQGG